ncbi:hypothetical protein [Domibacillus indicus]|uniref:hypothetical protein n=1 Tax=Domibacillus indicus TaxID=1437523 RepID=UPI000617BEFB|nr:hypothetical protein [Domibacillus indicus]
MQRKIIASFGLFTLIYFSQQTPFTKAVFTNDFSFASFSSAYEERFGTLLPAMDRTSTPPASLVSTNSMLAAEKNGMVIRIDKDNISIQQEDGTVLRVSGLKREPYRLFERIKQGEPVGTPAGRVIEFVEQKSGQILSTRKVTVNE